MTGKRLSTEEKERIENLTAEGFSPHRIAGTLERSPHTIRGYIADAQERIATKLEAVAERAIDSITEKDYTKASLVQKITGAAIAIDKRQLLLGRFTSINVTALWEMLNMIRDMRDGSPDYPHGPETLTQKAGCQCALCLPRMQPTRIDEDPLLAENLQSGICEPRTPTPSVGGPGSR